MPYEYGHLKQIKDELKKSTLYIRRGELLEKVKAQCGAFGDSASKVVVRFKSFGISSDKDYQQILLFDF